jgi:hypothetical protein
MMRAFQKRASSATTIVMVAISFCASAQLPTGASQPTVQPPALPITTQAKKTIAFLRTDCLHDYRTEVASLTKEKLEQMPIEQETGIARQLIALTSRLQTLKVSLEKLNPDDLAYLKQNIALPNDAAGIAAEAVWRASILVKMTSLTRDEIVSMKPEELAILPSDQHLGTGFFVGVTDPRIVDEKGAPAPQGVFTYLVTNRHVVQPGIEVGKPCQVIESFIILNHMPDATHPSIYAETSRIDLVLTWSFSETDDSVDLAITPIGMRRDIYDFLCIPTTQFVTDEQVQKKVVVEGDPVLFSGLFIQSYSEAHTLEPIVRSGTLAMVPYGLVKTTINNKLGHIYLAEAHAFGGNSGSPMFIDTNKFANIISGPSYSFLGVISGEVLENSDFTLNVTTSFSGTVGANSDVSMIVPASEVLKILNNAKFQSDRDDAISKQRTSISVQPMTSAPTPK